MSDETPAVTIPTEDMEKLFELLHRAADAIAVGIEALDRASKAYLAAGS